MKTLSKQEIIDILYGCTILGTGGGGDLELGLEAMQQDFDEGKELKLISLDELPDDEYIASPYMCGAPTELDNQDPKFEGLNRLGYPESLLAFKTIEEYFGKKFYAAISTELGGANTAYALHTACQLGIPIVDGDPAGRSVPELQHSTFFVSDVPSTPMALATQFGDTMIINELAEDMRSEDIVRAVAIVSGNKVGVTDHPVTGEKIKTSVIPGAISNAQKLGQALREAKENNEDVAKKLIEVGKGKILFRGKVKDFDWRLEDGFNFGETEIEGIGEFTGQSYIVWYKNEHIVSYRNGKIDVTVPDLICVIDKDGIPVTNPNYKKGQELIVFALPAPEIWKTEKGLEVFGPKSFGFDVEYVPFDKKMEE